METDIPILVKNDPWLEPYKEEINGRLNRFINKLKDLESRYGSLKEFAEAYHYFGFNYDHDKKGWWYREWAPNAKALYLIGDFNNWDRQANPLERIDHGIWEIFLDDETYKDRFTHNSSLKVHVVSEKNALDRIPAYIRRVEQPEGSIDFVAKHWVPAEDFEWNDENFDISEVHVAPIIYESHVGMATEKEDVGTYLEFAEKMLPRIKKLGYNTVQLMAVQEHPYYGSFGYHVSNFFAPSSRFGTPKDLKYLVNKAHEMGMAVIMDIVHSHAVKNIAEGLNEFDGSDDQYFHKGGKGEHSAWDSKLFNYGKEEVVRFLLSNVKYWIEEYHMDGFRFDGVTSMLYFHHGDHTTFDNYEKYFKDVDWDVLVYLQLANKLTHDLKPNALTIAEDMSGMPGLCRPQEEGGIGFDFRLGMGIPDFWIKYLKEKDDESWDIFEMYNTMTNRRYGEKTIAYAESHDQAIVGDKTVAFWLMDKEMYSDMHVNHDNLIIDRGLALHKMIRFFTLSLGGEGYLNFIGNEFGHPEWVDFPREGNGWSFKYARRQWSLVDNPDLRYKFLYAFDEAMIHFARAYKLLPSLPAQQINMDPENKTVIFERNNLIFLFNFHMSNSIPDYRFKVPSEGKYKIIINTDNGKFGGFDRVDEIMTYPAVCLFGDYFLSVYLPNRVAMVLEKVE